MNWRLVALIAWSLSPWAYLVAAAMSPDLWSRMEGFGFLPFAALVLAKQMVLKGRDGRAEAIHRRISASQIMTASILAVLLTIGVIIATTWLRDAVDAPRVWVIALVALVAATSIVLDVRHAHRSSGGKRPGSS